MPVGAIVSSTIMVCTHVAVLPDTSDTLYTLDTVSGQLCPSLISLNSVQLEGSTEQLSSAIPPPSSKANTFMNGGTSVIEHCVVAVGGHVSVGAI
jgi:hypothetical protein